MDKRSILIFGLGFLQKSLIEQCKALGLYTVGVDITPDAICKNDVDAFEIADGDDYEATLEIAKRYQVVGVVTAATDKPLVMMAKVAEALKLPFYSVQTAEWSTDKLQMKYRFQEYGISCAKGIEVKSPKELDLIEWNYPVIVKPRDNSGSRGVIFCEDRYAAIWAVEEAFKYTNKGSVLVEEFIDGHEYSIESLHYDGKTHVIQFTQKITTQFPYNVELGHIQPADLSEEVKDEIRLIIANIAKALKFDNCASHTELKINERGITIIETSPRLGGDFITSMLTPLSTGVNIEKLLVRMSVGDTIQESDFVPSIQESSGVAFFELPEGELISIGNLDKMNDIVGVVEFELDKKAGDQIKKITNSIDRYGYMLFKTNSRESTEASMRTAKVEIERLVRIKR